MMFELDIENLAPKEQFAPSETELYNAIKATLNHPGLANKLPASTPELSLRIVASEEIQALNKQYRHQDKSTNVLSFPADIPPELELGLLGDIIICAEVVNDEAAMQHKTALAHWLHMCIHGCLHLLGFDHIDAAEAEQMESLEISILDSLGYSNPYIENQA